jgi:hypothetical protein
LVFMHSLLEHNYFWHYIAIPKYAKSNWWVDY